MSFNPAGRAPYAGDVPPGGSGFPGMGHSMIPAGVSPACVVVPAGVASNQESPGPDDSPAAINAIEGGVQPTVLILSLYADVVRPKVQRRRTRPEGWHLIEQTCPERYRGDFCYRVPWFHEYSLDWNLVQGTTYFTCLTRTSVKTWTHMLPWRTAKFSDNDVAASSINPFPTGAQWVGFCGWNCVFIADPRLCDDLQTKHRRTFPPGHPVDFVITEHHIPTKDASGAGGDLPSYQMRFPWHWLDRLSADWT
eukprot:IDg10458t1